MILNMIEILQKNNKKMFNFNALQKNNWNFGFYQLYPQDVQNILYPIKLDKHKQQ